MATPPSASRPGRALAVLAALIVILYAVIPFVAPDREGDRRLSLIDKYTARLGLDLEGGTQITLTPVVASGQEDELTEENIDQAVEILRLRVNSFGVSEAEVTSQGSGSGQTIVVSIPGESSADILEQVQQTAELRFRQVLSVNVGTPPPPVTATPSPEPSSGASPEASGEASAPASSPAPEVSTPSVSSPDASAAPATQQRVTSSALRALAGDGALGALAASATPTATPSGESTPAAVPDASASPSTAPGPVPTTAAEITPELSAEFAALDCSQQRPRGEVDDPEQALVACGRDDGLKYILGAAVLVGTDVEGASAAVETTSQGFSTGGWQVVLDFTGDGSRKFSQETTRINVLTPPENQLAIVLDGQVVSAPTIEEAITGGSAQITGSFSQDEARDLANVLQYGALPLSFEPSSVQEISPTLGASSLRGGLIAGGLGLVAVVLYMLLYYRLLGFVAAVSLVAAGVISWGLVVLLGWQIGFRLSLAGIAGLIVAIGITADSFVVFFERLRDEVREGKTLRVAVESGWRRARRTIIVSDIVSLLAATVLYVLSTAGVRGFAFTLGLTTLVDIAVVFLFTKPLVTLYGRAQGLSGSRWSGLDPRRLGVAAPVSPSLAASRARERRRAAEVAAKATASPAPTSGSVAGEETR